MLRRLSRLAVLPIFRLLAVVPDPAYLMKKIPFWKLTVSSWSAKEFKTQTAKLTEDMVSVF